MNNLNKGMFIIKSMIIEFFMETSNFKKWKIKK